MPTKATNGRKRTVRAISRKAPVRTVTTTSPAATAANGGNRRPGLYKIDKRTRDKVMTRLRDIPENHLTCRQYRHAWEPDDVPFVEHKVKGSTIMHLRLDIPCARDCGVWIREVYIVTTRGGVPVVERISRSMNYPEGYQQPGIPRGVKPLEIFQQIRFERRMREVAGATPDQRDRSE